VFFISLLRLGESLTPSFSQLGQWIFFRFRFHVMPARKVRGLTVKLSLNHRDAGAQLIDAMISVKHGPTADSPRLLMKLIIAR
jgi:hypothetical protein